MPLLSKWLTRTRLSRIRDHLGKRVLDVGCGQGELLDFLPPGVERVVLLDRRPERQKKIAERLSDHEVEAKFLVGDVEQGELDFPPGSFDTIVMAALIEHLRTPSAALACVHKLLSTEGKLVLTTPSPLGGRLHWVASYLGLVYAEAAQEHERFYDFPSLARLLDQSGFLVEHFERFLFGLNQLVVARKRG